MSIYYGFGYDECPYQCAGDEDQKSASQTNKEKSNGMNVVLGASVTAITAMVTGSLFA